ncbi:hypothetical protein LZ554_003650 [Drepanopeziza brunnea f. sp. 'monogermtubi']|nr:hypothetical protein LZ554_003650 [Drepanopeziza brunnea f. sp. 'monogermtubi']
MKEIEYREQKGKSRLGLSLSLAPSAARTNIIWKLSSSRQILSHPNTHHINSDIMRAKWRKKRVRRLKRKRRKTRARSK